MRTATSVLFVIPWGRHWIIGTTDTPWDLDKAHPAASRTDIDYLLDQVNRLLKEPLGHDDVEGVYAGLRPLLTGESEPTSRISREHTVVTPVPGLVIIAGGKLTTYRVMGEDAVDAAAHSLGGGGVRVHHRPGPARRGRRLETRSNQRARLARESGVHRARIDHLLGPLRRARRRGARAGRRAPRLAPRSTAPRTTCGSRSSTPSRTRARGTSTTC